MEKDIHFFGYLLVSLDSNDSIKGEEIAYIDEIIRHTRQMCCVWTQKEKLNKNIDHRKIQFYPKKVILSKFIIKNRNKRWIKQNTCEKNKFRKWKISELEIIKDNENFLLLTWNMKKMQLIRWNSIFFLIFALICIARLA